MHELYLPESLDVTTVSASESARRRRLDSLVADMPDLFRLPELAPALCASPRVTEVEPAYPAPMPMRQNLQVVRKQEDTLIERLPALPPLHTKPVPKPMRKPSQDTGRDHAGSSPQMTPDIMTGEEAADYLRIGLRTLREWTRERRIPHAHIGRRIRYRRQALLEWLAAQETI